MVGFNGENAKELGAFTFSESFIGFSDKCNLPLTPPCKGGG